ncbi:MAG: hypothetical protein IPM97_12120 [Bdellovibrionaceae bacterium]|nr:hypothetical protein [Pseudobdellovibrionaceae bacterium]
MKKIKFHLFLMTFLGVGGGVVGASEIDISGELNLAATLYQLPTRDQGTLAFSIPSLRLDVEVPLRENNELFFQLESAERRDSGSKRYDTQLKEAYLSLVSPLAAASEIRYGLVPNYWIEAQKEHWGFDIWGLPSFLPLLKYGYMSWSDLGLMYQAGLSAELGTWGIIFSNGEGLESDEVGARKQVQLVINLNKMAPLYALLNITQGYYDHYDEKINEKRRLASQIGYQTESGLFALEYFVTQDPAEAITALKLGGGVDAAALNGNNVAGQGVSLLAKIVVSDKWQVFVRGDWLNPIKEDSQKTLQDWTGGFSHNLAEDIFLALSYEYTHYSEQFMASPRDASQFVFATQVSF